MCFFDANSITKSRLVQLDPIFVCFASEWVRFDPHVRQHSFVEIGHEIISTAILSLPLIQERQLLVTGERMYTNGTDGLAQEQCG